MESNKRSSFSGSIGFVLAAAGSAVGLGNIWRFPYLAAKDGGGLFLVTYVILALTFGFTLLTTEIAIGRKTAQSPLTAYSKLHKSWGWIGVLACAIPVIILPYYSAIGGWILKYLAAFITDAAATTADGYFTGFITSQWSPILWFAVYLAITTFVVYKGVDAGIERLSKILMPVLLVLILGISLFSLTLRHTDANGVTRTGLQGLAVYVIPNLEGVTLGKFVSVLMDAMGQLFYSISVAMGIMIAYGSYVKKETNLVKSVNQIELFDTGIALLAGLMIIPAVFAFQGEEGLTSAGVGLMFQTLPAVFGQMPGGSVVGFVFFVLVFFAALTSSISLMETIVSMLMDRTKLGRKASCALVFVVCIVLGVPSSLGFGLWSHILPLGMDFLTFFDFISNSVVMPIVALLTCILIGWVIGTKVVTDEVTLNGEKFGRKALYEVMTKYLAPICLVVILVFSVLSGMGIIKV